MLPGLDSLKLAISAFNFLLLSIMGFFLLVAIVNLWDSSCFLLSFFPLYFQPNVAIIYWSSPSLLIAQFISMSNRSQGQSLFQTRFFLVCKRCACFIEGCIIVFGVLTSTLFINVTVKLAVKTKYSPFLCIYAFSSFDPK